MPGMEGTTSLPAPADASPRPFAYRDFRRLWVIGLVVFMVRWLEMLAVSIFVWQATGSAFLVAMMGMLRILPMGLFGAPIGVLAERVQPRSALTAIVLVSLLTSAALAGLAMGGMLAVWHLALASFINGIAWAADNPVRRMLIGQVVGPARMGEAMSFDVGSNNASRMLGPTVSGLLFAAFGIEGSFLVSVVLYLFALLAAATLRYRSAPAPATGEGVLARMGEGLLAVRRSPRLRGTLVVTILFNIFGWPFTSLVPVVAQDRYGLGPEATGLLASMDGVGAFAGALLMAGTRQAGLVCAALSRWAGAVPGDGHRLRRGAECDCRRRRAAAGRLRPVGLQHHAGDIGLPAGAGRGADAGARPAVGLHRARADRLPGAGPRGRCAGGDARLRADRGGRAAGAGAVLAALACHPGEGRGNIILTDLTTDLIISEIRTTLLQMPWAG